ncbi:MAG: IS1 family transposase [Cyanobacteria bacterium P01_F01_bin.53]
MTKIARPPLSSLACVNPACDCYGESGTATLTVRKVYGKDKIRYLQVYGKDKIRYLRCQCCGEEFSERKNTALWNTKIPEVRAIAVSRQLSEGTSLKGTARLTQTHRDTVRRLTRKVGEHVEKFHEQTAQQLDIDVLEMDERHGYVGSKAEQCWDGVAIDAASKFVVQVEVGPRDQVMIERLMRRSANRLAHPQDWVLMTDGEACYRTLFPVIFGVPYLPPVQTR